MADSDLNGSVDSSLCYNLRGRRAARAETNPDRRCKVVEGWPKSKQPRSNMYSEDGQAKREIYPTQALQQLQRTGNELREPPRHASTPRHDSCIHDEVERMVRVLNEFVEQLHSDEEFSGIEGTDLDDDEHLASRQLAEKTARELAAHEKFLNQQLSRVQTELAREAAATRPNTDKPLLNLESRERAARIPSAPQPEMMRARAPSPSLPARQVVFAPAERP
jgi:hypothetical protein